MPRSKYWGATCALLAAFAIIADPAPASAQEAVAPLENTASVYMTHVPSFSYAGLYVAVDKGYFASRGLNVELIIVRGGDTSYQVGGRTIEFAGGSADAAFFNSLQRGMTTTLIASLAANKADASANPLVVRKDLSDDETLSNVEDLRGRRVANLAPGGITEYLLELALSDGGLSVEDIDLVSPMGFAQMVEGFSTQAIDAALLAEPFATLAEQRGHVVRLPTTKDLGEQILTIKTNTEYADANPDVVVNFLVGYLMGVRDLNENGFTHPKNLEIIKKYTQLDDEVIAAAVLPRLPGDGALDVESIMRQQSYYMARGYVDAQEPLVPETFVNNTYLRSALATLAAE